MIRRGPDSASGLDLLLLVTALRCSAEGRAVLRLRELRANFLQGRLGLLEFLSVYQYLLLDRKVGNLTIRIDDPLVEGRMGTEEAGRLDVPPSRWLSCRRT